ncbi:MAG: NAD-dependent protein deacylase [Clostridia bacterium]|nr:NAD-dependent protein deacylase [Clostridia bacterium]
MDEKIKKLREILNESKKIVFFGGAGVSTESGIPDFRSASGVFSMDYKYPPEMILSHTFFETHTKEFYKFYRDVMLYPDAEPNDAHKALAELERQGKLLAVITQNIDGLHQKAGSRTVYELHGSVHRNYCTNCGKTYGLKFIIDNVPLPVCSCGGLIKPDVVLYEESLDPRTIDNSIIAINSADTLIIGGTSLNVYPAAGLIDYFRGKNLVLINKSETQSDAIATLCIHDSIGKVLKEAMA